jgi:DNA repair photolyase
MLFGDPPSPGLTGIAKLAAQSPSLEAKAKVEYFEIPTRSLMNRTRPGMPFTWTINPYRGCEFGCKYCYARYTHEFMELHGQFEFENRIYAKANVAAILKRELKRRDLTEGIAIGTATDPYQPAERRFGVTRSILEVLRNERGRSVSVTTKSDLIVRDVDLLREVASRNFVHVNMTVTTLDVKLARLLEPRAPRPDLRLAAVRKLAEAGVDVGVFSNPIMPLITDRPGSLELLASTAKEFGARYFGGGVLFLMPAAQKVFFPFLEEQFPHLVKRYRERYEKNPYLRGVYLDELRKRVRSIRTEYGLASGPGPDPKPEPAPTLFPLFEERATMVV